MSAVKLSKAYSIYGASMGRRAYHGNTETTARFSVTYVPLDNGGYDNGGAYWGTGERLWRAFAECADSECGQIEFFMRARSRQDVIAEVRKQYPQARFFNSKA